MNLARYTGNGAAHIAQDSDEFMFCLFSDVTARDAQCLELLKTLGHEGSCPAGIPGFLRRKNSDLIACNCNRSKLAALLGRTAG